jgi:Flp pilus assembly protein TadD
MLFSNIWAAAAVGLLFGVHPMTVEPIPWVGERKTLLAAFFSLWSLIFYVFYSRTTHNARRTTALLYVGSLVTYLLALMSKPTSTPLPLVMLLLDYWPLRRLSWRTVLEKVPFFVLAGISAIITYISQSRTALTVSPAAFGAKRILLVLCHNIIFYPSKMIWPANLSSHYAFPEPLALSQPMILAGVIGTFVLVLLLLLSLRWTHAALTGWLIFMTAIFPAMGAIGFTNVIAADKFAYLPSIGVLIALAAFLSWLLPTRSSLTKLFVVTVAVLLLAAAETFVTRQHLAHWRDSLTLYEYMLKLTPNAVEVNNNLGLALQAQNRLDEAIACYQRALRARPEYPESNNNLAGALLKKGRIDEAISYYRQALRFKPDYAEAQNNIGSIFLRQGKLTEAISHFQKALTFKPDNPDIYYNLGFACARQGDLAQAAEYLRKALNLRPDDTEVCCELVMTLLKQDKAEEALVLASRAAEMTKYKDPAILELLASAYAAAGRFDDAVKAAEASLKYAHAAKNESLIAEISRKLELYKQKKH